MHVWDLPHAARWKYRTQKWRKKSPSGYYPTSLSGYIFAIKAGIDNRKKKLVKQQYLIHISLEYGELRLTSGWDRFFSLGTHANFNGFRVLAALLHGSPSLGVSQTLRCWTEGATHIRQGGHHVGHWPTFLVGLDFRFSLLWSPYGIGQTIIFFDLWFLLSFFFSSPNLSCRRLDVCHTSTHGVALAQI